MYIIYFVSEGKYSYDVNIAARESHSPGLFQCGSNMFLRYDGWCKTIVLRMEYANQQKRCLHNVGQVL